MRFVCVTRKIIFLFFLEACSKNFAFAKNNSIRGSTISRRKQHYSGGRRIEQANQGRGNGDNGSEEEIPFDIVEITVPENGKAGDIKEKRVEKNKVGKKSKGKAKVDKKGNKHQRFEVTINDIPIFGYQEIVHENQADGLERVTKNPMPDLIDFDTVPSITEDDAVQTALDYLEEEGIVVDVVENKLNVLILKGKPRLVFNVAAKRSSKEGLLVGKPLIFVDAEFNRVLHVVETLNNGAEPALLEDSKKITYNNYKDCSEYKKVVGTDSDPVLLAIHDNVQIVLDFLNSTVGYNSYDGEGAQVKSYGHYGYKVNNAYYEGGDRVFLYGDGDGVQFTYLGTLDIVAHEIGHAVTNFSSGLIYYNESGAIDEGASDILGAAVTAFAEGEITDKTWLHGEDAVLNTDALRYFAEPTKDGYSKDHYAKRYTGSGDDMGVHRNSGILNHWFYLLVVGGQHNNPDYRTGNIINAIGMDAAFDIWFHTWTNELTPNSDFKDALEKTLMTCYDLGYGKDDDKSTCISVQNAWAEVGVGKAFTPLGHEISNIVCDPGEIKVQLYITTDQYADTDNALFFFINNFEEMLWYEYAFRPVTQYEPYEVCLDPLLCHRLWFTDLKGNGFSSAGSIFLIVDGKVEMDRDFGYGYATKLGNCPPYTTVLIKLKTDQWGDRHNYLIVEDQNEKTKYYRSSYAASTTNYDSFDIHDSECVKIEVRDRSGDGIVGIEDALTIYTDNVIQYQGKVGRYGARIYVGKGC